MLVGPEVRCAIGISRHSKNGLIKEIPERFDVFHNNCAQYVLSVVMLWHSHSTPPDPQLANRSFIIHIYTYIIYQYINYIY